MGMSLLPPRSTVVRRTTAAGAKRDFYTEEDDGYYDNDEGEVVTRFKFYFILLFIITICCSVCLSLSLSLSLSQAAASQALFPSAPLSSPSRPSRLAHSPTSQTPRTKPQLPAVAAAEDPRPLRGVLLITSITEGRRSRRIAFRSGCISWQRSRPAVCGFRRHHHPRHHLPTAPRALPFESHASWDSSRRSGHSFLSPCWLMSRPITAR